MGAEINRCCQTEREALLKQAGLQDPIDINSQEGVAFKADLAIPRHKMRHIRRYVIYLNK